MALFLSTIKGKIYLLAALAVLICFSLASSIFYFYWNDYHLAYEAKLNTHFYATASSLIHEIQKERGKSTMFINGVLSDAELSNQRSAVDSIRTSLDKSYSETISFKKNQNIEFIKTSLESIRKQVDQRVPAAEAAKVYTDLIALILNEQIAAAHLSQVKNIESFLLGLSMLELAKENTGRLRAFLTGIIGKNQALNMQQISLLETYKSGIETNLYSKVFNLSNECLEKIEKFRNLPAWTNTLDAYKQVMNKSNEGNFNLDGKIFFSNISEAIDNLAEIVKIETTLITQETDQMHQSAKRSMQIMLFIMISIILFLFIFSGAISKNIAAKLLPLTEELSKVSVAISKFSHEIENSSEHIASKASESASALEETVASLSEVSSQTTLNSQNSVKAKNLSLESHRIANLGDQEIKKLINSMQIVSQSTIKMNEIINVIDDISFQTNLLALNATVEAARAGEHGKGFAVVADAVRGLAQKSANSTKDIIELINDILNKSSQGAATATQSNEALASILNSVNDVMKIVEEISTATSEQSIALDQINKAMNQIDQSVQANASIAAEMTESSKQLSKLDTSLTTSIRNLKMLVSGVS